MKSLGLLLLPFVCSCGGLVTWVEGAGSTGEGGATSSSNASSANIASTGAMTLDCSKQDAFDCESKQGCISACISTPDQGCFATCRPLTSVACQKTCTDPAPFCPTGMIPEGDGTCYTGYCIKGTVCFD